jgi:Domain of unknown function (DUF6285)
MSQDRPAIDDLLLSVEQLLGECAPKLAGELRYHAQVAAYLLQICRREIRLASGLDAAEREALIGFLGRKAPLDELERGLAENIRAGVCDAQWEAALDLVLAQTIDKVRIVRPDHLAPEHRLPDPAAD